MDSRPAADRQVLGFLPEALALLPLSARDVLICDGPGLAAAYRAKNPRVRMTGIGRVDPAAVDTMLTGDPGALQGAQFGGPFDLVVIDETLGLSEDPARLLRRLCGRLKPGGHVIAILRNDVHWSRMKARTEGRAVPKDGLASEAIAALLEAGGLAMRRMRSCPRPADDAGQLWIDAVLAAYADDPAMADRVRRRLLSSHFVAVATKPIPDQPITRPMRLHQLELARGMDVRTRVPAEALAAEPDLNLARSFGKLHMPDFGREGGVVIVQRPRVSDPQRILDFAAACQRRGVVMVIEYDDDPSLVARTIPREDVPAIYDRNMALAHAVQTSTGVLARQFGRVNPEVMVFPNCAEDLPPARNHRAGPLRVLFGALNRTRVTETAALFAPAIAALPDLEFEVIHERAFFDALPTEQKRFTPLLPYRDYLDLLGRCDICLMPLEGLPEELGKSDVKWVEAASRGSVAIASPAVYADTIRHGENGLIAATAEDWSALLIQLANDPARRNQIAATARTEVLAGRMMADQTAARRDWYRSLLARRDDLYAAALARSLALAAALASG